jgi:hypothetical protein
MSGPGMMGGPGMGGMPGPGMMGGPGMMPGPGMMGPGMDTGGARAYDSPPPPDGYFQTWWHAHRGIPLAATCLSQQYDAAASGGNTMMQQPVDA